jgi:hypothetical protein
MLENTLYDSAASEPMRSACLNHNCRATDVENDFDA